MSENNGFIIQDFEIDQKKPVACTEQKSSSSYLQKCVFCETNFCNRRLFPMFVGIYFCNLRRFFGINL